MKRKNLFEKKKRKDKIRKVKMRAKGKTYITLICKKCKEEFRIRTTNLELYTPEVIENWKCLNCKHKEKK